MHPTLQAALDCQAAGLSVTFLKPNSLKPPKDWALSTQTPSSLAEGYEEHAQLGLVLGRELGSDPFDMTPVSQVLTGVHCVVRSPAHEASALLALEQRFPDWQRYPRVNSGDGSRSFVVLFTLPQQQDSRPIVGAAETCVDGSGKKRPAWDLMLLGHTVTPIPPTIASTGGSYTWGPLTLLEALDKKVDIGLDQAGLERLVAPVKQQSPTRMVGDIEDLPSLLNQLPSHAWREDYLQWLQVGQAIALEYRGSDDETAAFAAWKEWTQGVGPGGRVHDQEDLNEVWGRFGYDPSIRRLSMQDLYRAAKRTRPTDLMSTVRDAPSLEAAMRSIAELTLTEVQNQDAIALLRRRAEVDGIKMTATALAIALKKERKLARKRETAGTPALQGGLEVALARYIMANRFTHTDGEPTLVTVKKNHFLWAGGRWANVEDEEIKQAVLDELISLDSPLQPGTPDYELKKALKLQTDEAGRTDYARALRDSLSSVISSLCLVPEHKNPLSIRSSSVPRPPSINCANKFLTFQRDGSLTEEDSHPRHHCFYTLGCGYHPEAVCPVWLSSLDTIFGHLPVGERAEAIRHLQELFGYVLQTSRMIPIFIYLKGATRAGKTMISRVLRALVGNENVDNTSLADLDAGRDTHATASLVGKRLLVDDDVSISSLLPDGMLKKLSADQELTANPKGGSKFSFQATVVPMFLANHWIKTRDLDDALKMRAHVFEFPNTLKKRDPYVQAHILEHELPGVLNWAIEGFKRVLMRGMEFDKPESCREAMKAWFDRRDSVRAFSVQHYARTDSNNDKLLRTDVYKRFREWALDSGLQTMSNQSFYERFPMTQGFAHDQKYFYGIKCKVASWGPQTYPYAPRAVEPDPVPPPLNPIEEIW